MKKYYIAVREGVVGNCMLWWRQGGHGYTLNLDEAELFDETDDTFKMIMRSDKSKFSVWEHDYIVTRTERHVQSTSLDFQRKAV